MSKTINKKNMITRIDQSIKLDYLDEQIEKMVNGIDKHYHKSKPSKSIEKLIYEQDLLKKKRKWFVPTMCLVFFTFGACATIAVYYLLIDSNIIRKKKIKLDYEVKKNENDPNDTGEIYIKPTIY